MAAASKSVQSGQISPRVLAARENGKRGGLVTAQRHGSDYVQAKGGKGGRTTRDRYGRDFFAHIAKFKKQCKGWPAGKPRKKVEVCLATEMQSAAAAAAASN